MRWSAREQAMQVTVVGTGNVGAALLLPMAYNQAIDQLHVLSRQEGTALAAIMDVASATPEGAQKMRYDDGSSLCESDLVIITSGVNQKGKTAEETHEANLEIARSVIDRGPLKSSAILICIATPVDYLTAQIQRECGLPMRQVIGFGGDLDTNRLRYILQAHGIPHEYAHAIGEHGPNAIPVYPEERDYEKITAELRGFWRKLADSVDVVRNIATADLLAKLVNTLVTDGMERHNVCAYHQDYGVYMTWPFKLGHYGVEDAASLEIQPQARKLIDELVEQRQRCLSSLPVRKLEPR
jgi:L-lactate dehydrogenase